VTDKQYLIDSILNGFDVPKIYVADFTWGDSPLHSQKLCGSLAKVTFRFTNCLCG